MKGERKGIIEKEKVEWNKENDIYGEGGREGEVTVRGKVHKNTKAKKDIWRERRSGYCEGKTAIMQNKYIWRKEGKGLLLQREKYNKVKLKNMSFEGQG